MIESIQELIADWAAGEGLDSRLHVWNVRAAETDAGLVLSGETLDGQARQSLMTSLRLHLPGVTLVDQITPLRENAALSTIRRAVVNVYAEATSKSEVVTQALFGELIEVLRPAPGWSFVRVVADGYLGWVAEHALAPQPLPGPSHFVSANLAACFRRPDGGEVVGQLPFNVAVAVIEGGGEWAAIAAPDGQTWWARAGELTPLDDRPVPDAAGMAVTVARMARFVGTPYFWGGRTPFGYDCSGFAQTAMRTMGVAVLRDADQQFQEGDEVDGVPQPGDLLFFGRPGYSASGIARAAGVDHVAISLGGWDILHATGAVWSVTRNSLDPASPVYRRGLVETYLGARRFRCD
ncbi:MAG: C40 family peptidase [Anaerolineae bacterium]